MRIAYIISAYKSPDLLIRIVHRLHTPTSIFLIHVDKKTQYRQYQKMVSGVDHLANVVFLNRHNCHWGDFGHVRATLKGLTYLFENEVNFDYLFLLTGQDYPIKSNNHIESFLNRANGKEFISYYPFPNDWGGDGGLGRIEHWHFRFLEHTNFKIFRKFAHLPLKLESNSRVKLTLYSLINIVFKNRTLPGNMNPFGGPGYWSITRECAKFINTFVNNNPKYVKFFKYVDVPDESFFHTIILNSSFAQNVVNDDLRCIDISARRGPRIWQKQDFEILSQSKALIARKFDTTVDSQILDLIDSKLLSSSSDLSVVRPRPK